MFLSLVGLVSVCAKFRLPSLSKSGLKVPGGVVVWCWGAGVGGGAVWLRPISVFSLSLSQAEQYVKLSSAQAGYPHESGYLVFAVPVYFTSLYKDNIS